MIIKIHANIAAPPNSKRPGYTVSAGEIVDAPSDIAKELLAMRTTANRTVGGGRAAAEIVTDPNERAKAKKLALVNADDGDLDEDGWQKGDRE